MDNKQLLASAVALGASMAVSLYLLHGVPRPLSRLLGRHHGKGNTAVRAAASVAGMTPFLRFGSETHVHDVGFC